MSSEVKGIWFLSLKGHLDRTEGPGAWPALCERFLEEFQPLVRDPLPSAWYPEEMLQDQLGLMHGVLSGGDDERYVDLVEQVAVGGIGRFFRVLLGLGSPRFAMRQVPTLWARLRRGAGRCTVDAGPETAVVLIEDFPYLSDRNYQLLQIGTLRSILTVLKAPERRVTIDDGGLDWIRISAHYKPST